MLQVCCHGRKSFHAIKSSSSKLEYLIADLARCNDDFICMGFYIFINIDLNQSHAFLGLSIIVLNTVHVYAHFVRIKIKFTVVGFFFSALCGP